MKTMYIKIVMVALLLIASYTSYAQTLINDLYYEFDSQTSEATVVLNGNETASSINIPEEVTRNENTYKVTKIGTEAFHNNENLTSIFIPNTVKYIGTYAFANCCMLTRITLPSDITRIEKGTFQNCTAIKSLTIPQGVKTISNYAFHNCPELESIVLPSSINFISPYSFTECPTLKSITVSSPIPIAMYMNTFTVFGNLYVPKGSKEAYEKAAIWQDFNIIAEGEATGISTLNADHSPQSIYSISGTHLSAPRKGVNIINGKKVVIK